MGERTPIRDDYDAELLLAPFDGPSDAVYAVVKETFELTERGAKRTAPEPLRHDIRTDEFWPAGSDFWPSKAMTDVVVDGFACRPDGQPFDRRRVAIQIGDRRKEGLVFGYRVARLGEDGRWSFERVEAVEKVPLVPEYAYGGTDLHVPSPPPRNRAELLDALGDHPGAYPRNRFGLGYVAALRGAGAEVPLPLLEDPQRPLSPDDFASETTADWFRRPLPWFLHWMMPYDFPRSWFAGAVPRDPVPDGEVIEEVRRGWLVERWREIRPSTPLLPPIPRAYFQEASHNMRFADIAPGTPIRLGGMHPERDAIETVFPTGPQLEIGYQGDFESVDARPLHVVLRPHELRMDVTWVAFRGELPRKVIPGVHGEIPLAVRVNGQAPVPYDTPPPVRETIVQALARAGVDAPEPGTPLVTAMRTAKVNRTRPSRERDQTAGAESCWLGDVDVAHGRVVLTELDFVLNGSPRLTLVRSYSSTMSWRRGLLGPGWASNLEQRAWEQDGWILYRMADGREIGIPLPGGELGLRARVHHASAGVTLRRRSSDTLDVFGDDGSHVALARQPDGTARLAEIYGTDGSLLRVGYDSLGRLDRITAAGTPVLRFETDDEGRLTRAFALGGRGESDWVLATRMVYDRAGQLREVADGRDRVARYEYEAGRLTSRSPRNGERIRYEYVEDAVAARCVAELTEARRREISATPEVVALTDGLGNSFTVGASARGHVEHVLDYFANELTRTFDEASGMVTSQTTADGETTFMYDAAYHLADVSAPDAGSVQLEHDDEGRLTSERDADGHALTARWDHLGRLTAVTERDGTSVVYSYADEGALTSILTPSELRLELERDAAGKAVVGLTSPLGTRRITHDPLSRPSEVTDESGATQALRYDPSGRVKEHRLPADVRVTYQSDADGRVTSVHDGASARELERDPDGRLTHVDEGGGAGPRLHRDAEGRVTMFESEDFDFWELHRDAAGRLIEVSGWAGEALYLHRDHAGRITRSTEGRVRATVKRDGAGRPVSIEHFDESFQRFAWTPGGRLKRAQYADRVVTFERDGVGRITTEAADGREVKSAYDANGRRVALDSSLGLRVRIDRDAMGHATALRATLGSQALELAFERDALGRERRRRLPGNLELRWRRDGLGRALRRAVCLGDKELARLEVTWAGLDRVTGVRESQRGARPHTHDARGRLVKAGALIRALDPLGRVFRNPEQDDHTYEGARLVESYGNTYAYDTAGRRVSRTSALDEQTRYVWDGLGRLIEVHLPEGDRITYDYDGLGRMVRRRRESKMEIPGLDEPVWEATRETEFVWDGVALLHEIEGAKVTTWLRESGVLVGKLATDGAWAALTDPLGVVTELTDAGGNVAWRGAVDAYGTLALDAAQTDQPWRFAGHYEDPDTGLQHSWWRVYDPETGAYLSPNPLGIVAGSNLYEYLPDPLSHTSPLGLARGYATLGGAVESERLSAELVERFVAALDRGDGAAGPRACFDREAAAWRLPDPQAVAWGPWDRFGPARRMPPASRRYTRLPKHLGLTADDSPR